MLNRFFFTLSWITFVAFIFVILISLYYLIFEPRVTFNLLRNTDQINPVHHLIFITAYFGHTVVVIIQALVFEVVFFFPGDGGDDIRKYPQKITMRLGILEFWLTGEPLFSILHWFLAIAAIIFIPFGTLFCLAFTLDDIFFGTTYGCGTNLVPFLFSMGSIYAVPFIVFPIIHFLIFRKWVWYPWHHQLDIPEDKKLLSLIETEDLVKNLWEVIWRLIQIILILIFIPTLAVIIYFRIRLGLFL